MIADILPNILECALRKVFDERFDRMVALAERMAAVFEQSRQQPEKVENYGIRPEAMYTTRDLMDKFSCCDKTITKWRTLGLKYYQRCEGQRGSPIFFLGRDVIEFYKANHKLQQIKPPKPIPKDISDEE